MYRSSKRQVRGSRFIRAIDKARRRNMLIRRVRWYHRHQISSCEECGRAVHSWHLQGCVRFSDGVWLCRPCAESGAIEEHERRSAERMLGEGSLTAH